MDLTALVQDPVVARIAEMAIATLWQGTLVAGVLALCLRLLPRVSAAYRFATWAAAFVVLMGLSVFSLIPQNSVDASSAVATASGKVAGPLFSLDSRWSMAIVGLWLLLALFRSAGLAIHSFRLRKLWKESMPVSLDERVAAVLNSATADCERGPVEVCTTTMLQRPSVIGFLRPRILIPDWLYGRLTQSELEQIVLHEVEHLRRRDDWTNLAQKLCLMVFPLNLALAWIERRLCSEREMACDEGVVRVTRAPRAYAACLASLAERGLERRVEALSLGAWQRRPELVHRVHSILRKKGGLSPVTARLLVGALGCGVIAGSVELAQSPQLVAFVPVSSAMMAKAHTSGTVPSANALAVAANESGTARDRKNTNSSAQFMAVNASLRQPAVSASVPVKARRATGDLKAVPVMAKSQPLESGVVQEQQWIVLTAWTQVEARSTTASSGIRSDYDFEAASNGGAATTQLDEAPANRITVTQLIFRLKAAAAGQPADAGLPATTAANSTTKPGVDKSTNQSTIPTNPSTFQPGIATIRDGWLVLQL